MANSTCKTPVHFPNVILILLSAKSFSLNNNLFLADSNRSRLHFYVSKKGIGVYYLCLITQDKHTYHVRSTGLRYDKNWNPAPFVCGKTWLCLKKVTWRELFQCFLCQLKASFQWHIMRRKQRALLYVSYVLMSRWAYLCQNPKDKRLTRSLVNLSTRQLVHSLISPLVHSSTCPLVHPSTRPLVNFSTR